MRKEQVLRGGIVLAAIFAVAAFAGSGSAMAASNNCTRVGAWFGAGDSGITWMATDTPGPSATVGQLTLEWVSVDPTLGGFFNTAVRVTNGIGVWEKVNQRKYKYTWIAYGFDVNGSGVYVARASGIARMKDCDHVNLTYALELFGPSQDISTEVPAYGTFCGTGTETRIHLVQASCPQ